MSKTNSKSKVSRKKTSPEAPEAVTEYERLCAALAALEDAYGEKFSELEEGKGDDCIEPAVIGDFAVATWLAQDEQTHEIKFPERLDLLVPFNLKDSMPELPAGVDVHLRVVTDSHRAFFTEAADNAEEIDDLCMPVVTPEYLVAIALHDGKEECVKQLVATEDFDSNLCSDIVEEHLGAAAFDRLQQIFEEEGVD